MADPEVMPVDRLLSLITLEQLDRDLFRAEAGENTGGGRLFGGQVAAQALRAATETVDAELHVHSMHGYFLRPGTEGTPLILHVDRIRDGRSFTTRRVVVMQHGEAIFNLSASFQVDEEGGEYEVGLPTGVPQPDDEEHDWHVDWLTTATHRMPFEVRVISPPGADESGRMESARRSWMRTRGAMPDDRALHSCIAAFVSDMGAVFAAAQSVGARPGTVMGASLDHAIWFHRPIRMDEWFVYDLTPVSAHGARGLVHGTMISRDGVHGASVAQEALIRPRRDQAPG